MSKGMCPKCDSENIGKEVGSGHSTGDYKCSNCEYIYLPSAFKKRKEAYTQQSTLQQLTSVIYNSLEVGDTVYLNGTTEPLKIIEKNESMINYEGGSVPYSGCNVKITETIHYIEVRDSRIKYALGRKEREATRRSV